MKNRPLTIRSFRRWASPGYWLYPFDLVHPWPTDFRADPSEVVRSTRGGDLEKIFFTRDGRQADKWVHYLDAYDRHLARYRGQAVRLLEIGVSHGGSLQLWRKYFGPEATIYGVDIDQRCAVIDSDADIAVRIGSQDDPDFLRSVVAEMGGVDIVIDDGSHLPRHQEVSFDALFPLLADGGLYVVEDLHAAYWPPTGGLRRRGTFIERAKTLIDGMHAWYYSRPAPKQGEIAKSEIECICVYDSIVYIEKRHRQRPVATAVGRRSF